jgi:hypothetical protein
MLLSTKPHDIGGGVLRGIGEVRFCGKATIVRQKKAHQIDASVAQAITKTGGGL